MAVVNNSWIAGSAQWGRYLAAMRDQQWALLLGCLLLFCAACRKDKDSTAPNVRIFQPAAGSTVNIPDTITIGVHVEDDGIVEQLTVFLADANEVPVGPSVQMTIQSSNADVNVDLAITNERLATGQYTVIARASDGENDGRAFLDLNVQAAPLRLRSTFVVPVFGSPGPFPILRIDSTGAESIWTTTAELGGATIDLDHLYLAGTATLPLERRGIMSGSSAVVLANDNVPGSSLPFFYGLAVDPADQRSYVGTISGWIRGFNPQGNAVFTATSPSGTYSERTVVVGEVLVSASRDPVSDTRSLVNYAHSSGVQLAQYPLDQAPVAMHAHGPSHVLVFGNRNGAGVIQERNVVAGGVYEMQVFAGDPIQAVARIDEQTFAIARSSGIVRFSYPTNALWTLSSANAAALAFDPVSGGLLAGAGDQLITMNANTGTQLDVRTIPFSVGGILLHLNR